MKKSFLFKCFGKEGRNEIRIAIFPLIEEIWGMGTTSPTVVAAKPTLGKVNVKIDALAVAHHIGRMALPFRHSGIKGFKSEVEGRDIQRLSTCHPYAVAIAVGEFRPTHVGFVAALLRADIGEILVSHFPAPDSHE